MQYEREYLVGREPLTEEETFVLSCFKHGPRQQDGSLGEHEFHMVMSIMRDIMSMSEDGPCPYQFEPKSWEHDIDERYVTGKGCLSYSAQLHCVVDLLVRKHYLARDPENPIVIFEDNQPRLF